MQYRLKHLLLMMCASAIVMALVPLIPRTNRTLAFPVLVGCVVSISAGVAWALRCRPAFWGGVGAGGIVFLLTPYDYREFDVTVLDVMRLFAYVFGVYGDTLLGTFFGAAITWVALWVEDP